MPRIAKPYLYRGFWVTKAHGQFRKLCREGTPTKEVYRLFHEALAEDLAKTKPVRVVDGGITVGELAKSFCHYAELHLAPGTFRFYRSYLGFWCKWQRKKQVIGSMDVSEMKPAMLENFKLEKAEAGWRATTINHVIQSWNSCWNWALRGERIDGRNPWRFVKKLTEEHRERIITPEEFRCLLRNCVDTLFRQILLVYRDTGLRPSELAMVEWNMVNFDAHEIIIPAELTKTGKQRLSRTGKAGPDRVVPMCPLVERILRWRLKRCVSSQPTVFGLSYNATRLRFQSLRRRCGFKADEKGETLVLYSCRHTYGTGAAENGVPDRLIGELLGHTPGSPVTQRYINLAKSAKYRAALHNAARTAVGDKAV